MKITAAELTPIREAAAAIEAVSAAEVVVVVRRQSGHYRDIDLLVGSLLAFLALLFVIHSEISFPEWSVPLDVALCFALGTGLSAWLDLSRYLAPRQRRLAEVMSAAREAFFLRRVSHTKDRTGILIYWSLLERRIEVLFDSGAAEAFPITQRKAWIETLHRIEHAPLTPKALAEHLLSLAAILRETLPIQDDDENELCDEITLDLERSPKASHDKGEAP